jgi:hypothetical protein
MARACAPIPPSLHANLISSGAIPQLAACEHELGARPVAPVVAQASASSSKDKAYIYTGSNSSQLFCGGGGGGRRSSLVSKC